MILLRLSGTVPAGQRAQGWRERRVFFLTPQVMMNDLLRNALRPQDVKCLVIDEAHKALGSYSYCQVTTARCGSFAECNKSVLLRETLI